MTDKQRDISQLAVTINEHLSKRVHNGELTNIDLISIIDTLGSFLNLATFSDYANREGITYNGVKDRIKSGKVDVIELFKVKLIIDNQ